MNTKIYVLITLASCIGLLLTGFPAGAGQIETSVTLSVSGVIQQTSTPTPTPTPTGPYSYIINVSGSNVQMTNGTTGQIDYQSTNAAQVVNNAIGNLTQGNGSILFSSGTYNLQGSITGSNKNNITLDFANGATLFVANGMNTPAITVSSCNNWIIRNPTINGNVANQANATGVGGIGLSEFGVIIDGGSNNLVTLANIFNCGQFGVDIVVGSGNSLVTNCGVTNSKITFCGWNGISLGGNYPANEQNLYAINNEVAYCGDVGITTYGISSTIQNNYIHNMNGTLGYNNANFGVAVEGGSSDLITLNTLQNCGQGVNVGPWNNCTVSNNTILNSATIGAWSMGNYNTVKDNSITLSGTFGIELYQATSCTVSGNYASQNAYDGIYTWASNNNTFSLNHSFDNNWQGIEINGFGNYIIQNTCFDTRSGASRTQQYGIQMDSSGNILMGNYLYNNVIASILDVNVPQNTYR